MLIYNSKVTTVSHAFTAKPLYELQCISVWIYFELNYSLPWKSTYTRAESRPKLVLYKTLKYRVLNSHTGHAKKNFNLRYYLIKISIKYLDTYRLKIRQKYQTKLYFIFANHKLKQMFFTKTFKLLNKYHGSLTRNPIWDTLET